MTNESGVSSDQVTAENFGEKGIYIHIPFCFNKCYYCDFNSQEKLTEKEVDDYLKALELQFRLFEDKFQLTSYVWDTLYIGGGTPSVLKDYQVEYLNQIIQKYLYLKPGAEVTVELNPYPGSENDHMGAFLNAIATFANRLSIGFQSLCNKNLIFLGREHTKEDSYRTYNLARKIGFSNINIDLIYGIPGQSGSEFTAELAQAIEFGPEHISLYNLTFEPGTPLYDVCQAQKINPVPEEDEAQMYSEAQNLLTVKGYRQYELSNFSLPGLESRHNLIYWRRGEYFGFGPGAHSLWKERRFYNHQDLNHYLWGVRKGSVIQETWTVSKREAVSERIFLGLRLTGGVNLKEISNEFQFDVEDNFSETIGDLIQQGLLKRIGQFLMLTKKAYMISNRVFVEFLPHLDKR